MQYWNVPVMLSNSNTVNIIGLVDFYMRLVILVNLFLLVNFLFEFSGCRYVVGSNRALFLLKDGAKAWEVKDFLVKQERCEVVTIEGKDYPGKASQVWPCTL